MMATWADRIGRRVKLRDLHILMEVVQWGSMVKAANHLGVSAPVVSKTIADAERMLGVPLLDRRPNGVEPTAYGRALIKRGIAVFDELRQGMEDIEFLADPTAGEVRIGSTEPLAAGIVPAIIETLGRKYPRVLFHVAQADFATLERQLRAREIDLMIGRPAEAISQEDLDSEILANDRIIVVAGLKNRWAGRRKIELSKLVGELWSLPPPGSIPRLAIDDAFRSAGVNVPRAIVSTAAFQVHTHLLASGRFLTMLPESVIHFSAKPMSVKMLPVDLSIKLNPVVMVTLKNRTCSPVAQLFMDCAREVVRPLAKAQTAPRH
jgi:DNA-binding transcriptional LysR family regulator